MGIPDVFPLLRKGTGETPSDGGCLIQVAGWLYDGVSWTDSTPCVLPLLRSVAIRLNDSVPDSRRNDLLRFVPRLIGTGGGNENIITAHLVEWCVLDSVKSAESAAEYAGSAAEYARYAAESAARHAARYAAESAARYAAESAREAARSARYAARSAAGSAVEASIQFLSRMLDEYDQFVGRETLEIPSSKWEELVKIMN